MLLICLFDEMSMNQHDSMLFNLSRGENIVPTGQGMFSLVQPLVYETTNKHILVLYLMTATTSPASA